MALQFGLGFGSLSNKTDLYRFFYDAGAGSDNVNFSYVSSGGPFGLGRAVQENRVSSADFVTLTPLIGLSLNEVSSPFAGAWVSQPSVTNRIAIGSIGRRNGDQVAVFSSGRITVRVGGVNRTLFVKTPVVPFWFEVGSVDAKTYVYINGILRAVFDIDFGSFEGVNSSLLATGLGNSYQDSISSPCFWDLTDNGDGFNKFPMGPVRIQSLQNVANGSINEWAPNLGENWEATKSAGWSGGAGVETVDVGAVDMYKMDEMAWDTAKVYKLEHRVAAMSNNIADSKLTSRIDIKGSTMLSTPLLLPKSQAEPLDIASHNGGDFTKEDIDAAEFGVVSS